MNVDPVSSYAQMAKVIAIAVALMLITAMLFMGGRAVGKGQDAKAIAAKDKALLNASHALAGDAKLFRAIDAEAKRRIKAADDAKRAADKAAGVAAAAEREAKAQLDQFARREAQARRKPDCAALLDMDLAKVCGL